MIYLFGGAGNGNFGDELIVKEWLGYASRTTSDIVVDGGSASHLEAMFQHSFPKVIYAETFSKLRKMGPQEFWPSFRRGLRFFDNGGVTRYPEYLSLDAQFDRIELVHLHGGGYLNSLWPQNGFLLGVATAMKRRSGCRLVGTGLGIGPLPDCDADTSAELSKTLDEFDLFECRDIESFRLVRRFSRSSNVVLGLDDTYLSPVGPTSSDTRKLHISYYSAAKGGELVTSLLERARASGSFDEYLFWICSWNDRTRFEDFAEIVPEMKYASMSDLVLGELPVSEGDFMITARFHPHLMAARHGAQGVYFTNSAYYDAKHGSVVALGSPFQNISKQENWSLSGSKRSWIVEWDEERVTMKRRLAGHIYS